MSEESTTPYLVELTRDVVGVANRQDLDAVMSFVAARTVMNMSDLGIGTFEGAVAIRSVILEEFFLEHEQALKAVGWRSRRCRRTWTS
jgi:hypothetical protein